MSFTFSRADIVNSMTSQWEQRVADLYCDERFTPLAKRRRLGGDGDSRCYWALLDFYCETEESSRRFDHPTTSPHSHVHVLVPRKAFRLKLPPAARVSDTRRFVDDLFKSVVRI